MNTPLGMHDKDIVITAIVAHNCMVACIESVVRGWVGPQVNAMLPDVYIYIKRVYYIMCSLKIKAG